MSYRVKIRLLLALLTVSLFLTAIVLPNSYTPARTLEQTAKKLEGNIHDKEEFIQGVLDDSLKFNQLKTLRRNDQLSLKLIADYTVKEHVWFITLDTGRLSFWSGVKVLPRNPARIKPGRSFIRQQNGYYEAIRKDEGNFSAIFLFPVKINYAFQNKYLKNGFAKELLSDDDNIIELADITDKQFYPVHSIAGQYLFGVKLKDGAVNSRYFYSELTVWFFAFLVLCLLVNDFCLQMARKGHALLSIALLAVFIVGIRFINLHYCWPDFTFKLDLFNASHYASSEIFPSLGDFCINLLFINWFAAFIYINRNYLLNNIKSRAGSYLVLLCCTAFIIIMSAWLLALFNGLIINSNINFDVTNVLNLSGLSVVGLGMLCFAFLIFYLINDAFVAICIKLPISSAHKTFIFILAVAAATMVFTWYSKFNTFFLFMGLMVLIRAYDYRYADGRLSAVSLLAMVLVGAVISSVELNTFQSVKEIGQRKLLIKKLLVPDDANVNFALRRMETRILNDVTIQQAFGQAGQENAIKTRLQKLYFDGSLSRYELSVHQFNTANQAISASNNYSLSVFNDLVMYSSFKVSRYFYRENESFGSQNYFAVLPVTVKGVNKGSMVIELRSKSQTTSRAFPELLVEGSNNDSDDFKNYSYAFYTDGRLVSQSGSYVYDIVNRNFEAPLNTYRFITTNSIYPEWYRVFSRHNHLVFMPSKRNVIVVSKSENMLFFGVTSLTFFFVLLLLFSLLVVLIRWLWLRIRILYISDNRIKWGFRINFDKILYKTRIQFSMILAVVFTLVIVGFITFLFISTQYNSQQEEMIRGKIARITAAFEEGQFNKYIDNINNEKLADFDELANTYSADLTLFNLQGVPLISTQPKIYEYGLHVKRMNAKAFIYMSRLQKSEYVNDEQIGELRYKSVYAPLKNNKQQTVAYLQLPYFSNEVDYKAQVGALLNAMINVYALVFIAIGLLAVVIARQITAPLNFIQNSLSRIIYGKKNEPIKWDRDDEIGALVKEYNKMISALENSAQKLAQSERESAWREMAKQVAHEIKNPLTPLKLGLQLLDKSWKDKDPKFDQKFERFSKSFVEQIESLSSIASEFSAFAKMPDTKMVQLSIFEVLNQAVIIFKQMDNLTINYQPPEQPFIINADRDQLLRCFNNLLKNAIEATPPGRHGVIDLSYLITSKNILLSIKDNGNGIPENMREKIFEPNFTTKSSGTGLGLAFIKNSIENAGGKVWFETELNVGTTFYFSLPAAE
ncbi:GHKL domain-containing protein [Mucilaginibacter sp. UR6-1]|uniref:ATP-binding protein n=1 Tax=Mucilaginibacter sp. UR6-1 TaxID=1435643 RepID=UPI001E572B15|nr:ATP-binding protein [Mucilaginibacter sp. UR6-1]MCC8410737.1 GHKL domain-containing protein [Mucilaginibacter sp. UR6-1]